MSIVSEFSVINSTAVRPISTCKSTLYTTVPPCSSHSSGTCRNRYSSKNTARPTDKLQVCDVALASFVFVYSIHIDMSSVQIRFALIRVVSVSYVFTQPVRIIIQCYLCSVQLKKTVA